MHLDARATRQRRVMHIRDVTSTIFAVNFFGLLHAIFRARCTLWPENNGLGRRTATRIDAGKQNNANQNEMRDSSRAHLWFPTEAASLRLFGC
jgi:hypothetical protein